MTPSWLGFQEPKSKRRKTCRLDKEIKCSSFSKCCAHLIHSPITLILRRIEVRSKGERREKSLMLGSCFVWGLVAMDEWVTVRIRERAIYTTERKRLLKSTSQVPRYSPRLSTSTGNTKQESVKVCAQSQCQNSRRMSGLLTRQHYWREPKLLARVRGRGQPGSWHRDFGRLSGLLTCVRARLSVGSSDSRRDFRVHCLRTTRRQFQPTSGLPTPVDTEKVSMCFVRC